MFLAHEDLVTLTGRKTRPSQCRWLDHEGIPYMVAATGRVQVLRAVVEQRLGIKSAGAPVTEPRWVIFARVS